MSEAVTAQTILYPTWRELVKVAVNWDYGSLHSHSEIADILSVEKQNSEYYRLVVRANKELITHSKLLQNVLGTGYAVVNPNDYPEASQGRMDKALRHVRVAELISTYAPPELMDEHHRMIHDKHHQSVVSQRIMMEKEQKKSKRLLDLKPDKLKLTE